MPFERRITLPGSERTPPIAAQPVGSVSDDETVRVTVVLRRRGADPAIPTGNTAREYLSHEELAANHGANPDDIGLVEKFAHQFQLTIVDSSVPKRSVVLLGTAGAMRNAFGADFICYKNAQTGRNFRGRTGGLTIPAELEGVVIAVLGLDTRPIAKPHIRRRRAREQAPPITGRQAPTQPSGTFTPPQVAALYNFPTNVNGAGQTIAIIELGGGYSPTDLQTYFSNLGITEPTVTAVSVDGGTNSPGSSADAEVELDIEVAGSIAPGANIAVYFAPNTDQGFIDAITTAVHDTTRKPSVVSISWGGPEDSWTQQSQTAMNSALQDAGTLGVTVTVASGDNGSSDGVGDGKLHVDFPASSPYVLACGGTTLQGSDGTISSEVVWNETANNEGATGGGVSNVFGLPSYQNSAGVPTQPQTGFAGRGVPDVAGDADPVTGYYILVDGQNEVVGGTSAVAPLWAGLIALFNQQLSTPVGFINPTLYGLGESGFHDITSGNNDDSNLGYYSAQTGWDPCTGLGSPNGATLVSALSSGTTSSVSGDRVEIPGSAPEHAPDAHWLPAALADQEISATLILRRPETATAPTEGASRTRRVSRQQAEEALAASPHDINAVLSFIRQYGLTIVEENPAARTIRIRGTAQQMDKAFGTQLRTLELPGGQQCISYEGPLSVPTALAGIITAVVGLDQRPVAKHHPAKRMRKAKGSGQ